MNISLVSSKKTETFKIDYENGITCIAVLEDDKLSKYHFTDGKKSLKLITKDVLEKIKNSTFSEHYLHLKEVVPFSTLEGLKCFGDFDSLFYIGGSMDGMVRNRLGKPISTVFLMDDVFCQVYLDIENSRKSCEEILKDLKSEYIVSKSIVDIPSYNQNEDRTGHSTLRLEVKIPQETYEKIVTGDYFDDETKVKIFEFLKK